MIQYNDWRITPPPEGQEIARQYDNMSRTLRIQGDLPEGWEWAMLIKANQAMDMIPLTVVEGGAEAVLTEGQLALSGRYRMQLRGTQGEMVRHTNVIQTYIPESLSGDGKWPSVPSAFTALERRLAELASHPPVPGENGYWLIWDVEGDVYQESEFPLPTDVSGPVTPERTTFYQRMESKNLVNVPNQVAATPDSSFQVEVADNHYTFTKLIEATRNLNLRLDSSFTVPESGEYTFTVYSQRTDLGGAIYVALYNSAGSQLGYGFVTQNWQHSATVTLEAGQEYFYSVNTNYANLESLVAVGGTVEFQVQLEKGGVSTAWENPVILEIPAVHQNKQDIEDLDNRMDGVYPLDPLLQSGGAAACFQTIACIGDSLTAGVLDYNDPETGSVVLPGVSYPEQLAKLTGSTVYNCGYGGAVATHSAQAVSEYHSFQKIAEDRNWFGEEYKAQAYVIALGTNDIDYYGSFDGDVSADIDDSNYANNALTSVGGYAAIIQRILALQPKAKIFCVTIPKSRNTEAARVVANEKIKSIAKHFGCYVIDLYTYGVQEDELASWKLKYYTGYHLNALGYQHHAKRILTYMDWIMRNSFDFRNIAFIGEEYEYNYS